MDINQKVYKIIVKHLIPILKKNVTVFFTGSSVDLHSQLNDINGMLLNEASVIISENCCKMARAKINNIEFRQKLITDYSRMQKVVQGSTLVLIPALTRNTLVKIAIGIQDSLVTNGIAIALMSGIPVVAVTDNYEPTGEHATRLGLNNNQTYNAMLHEYEEKLASFGVKLVSGSEFACAIKENLYPELFRGNLKVNNKGQTIDTSSIKSQNLITYQDINGLQDGAVLVIKERVVITPLAKEFITRKNIQINYV